MSQSLSQIYVHLTFGTKERYPFIHPQVAKNLHEYIAGALKNYESPALEINSMPEHIHILFRLSKNYALAKVVEEIKKQSSKWIKQKSAEYMNFAWQAGYGAFSVSSSNLQIVKNYIENQTEHHRKVSFMEEISILMQHYEIIEYDPKYFWEQ